jgi:diguanylate cyclase
VHREDIERSLTAARAVLNAISSHGYPAHPRTYRILYEYAAGETPALKRAVDEILSTKPKLDSNDMEQLSNEFVSQPALVDRSVATGNLLLKEMGKLLGAYELAIIEASDRSKTISGAHISEDPARQFVHQIVDDLLASARDMEESNRHLERQILACSKEIASLKQDLALARAESQVDPLTSLQNRKWFDQSMTELLKRAASTRCPVSLMIVDIDHFKNVNDRFGHLVGDRIIRVVAEAIRTSVGKQAHLARYGGDEFVLLFAEAGLDAAQAKAESIRKEIAQREFKLRDSGESIGRISLSIGISGFTGNENARALIERADRCLYQAKRNGRNRVVSERELVRAA